MKAGVAGIVAFCATCLFATAAVAATVLIVRPNDASAAMAETLVRLRGELGAVGFATEMTDEPAGTRASRGWLESVATKRRADAVIAFLGDETPSSVEVWVVDKVTGKSVVRSVPFDASAEHAPQRLAIRALELLRSSFVEIDFLATADPQARPPATVVHFVESERKSRPEQWRVEVGGAALTGTDGVGPAFLPLVALGWSLGSGFSIRATAAGLGTRPIVQNQMGSAQVSQAFALLGGRVHLRRNRIVQPFFSLSAGGLHASVDARSDGAYRSGSAARWSFVADGAVGADIRLPDRFFLSLAADVQLAEPYVAIRFADSVVATSGRPNLLLTMTVGAWL